jgi:hypothetical protein
MREKGIAEGTIGLIMAVRREVSQELRFIALAASWIHQAIQTAIAEQDPRGVILLPLGSDSDERRSEDLAGFRGRQATGA